MEVNWLVTDRWRINLSLTWMNLSEKLRVRVLMDNVVDEGNMRSIDTGNHTDFYRITGT